MGLSSDTPQTPLIAFFSAKKTISLNLSITHSAQLSQITSEIHEVQHRHRYVLHIFLD